MTKIKTILIATIAAICMMCSPKKAEEAKEAKEQTKKSIDEISFAWKTGKPIIESDAYGEPDWIAIKDPSIVKYEDKWHLFCTLRGHERSHAMVYSSFDRFENAGKSKPIVMPNHDGYYCAPQVFYFTPHEKWYMVCQAKSENWDPSYQAAFATTTDIADVTSWSALESLEVQRPEDSGYLDFWVIADDNKVHLFYTCDNGKMYRVETSYDNFPTGWSEPELSYEGDIFEASHIYKLKEYDLYLNLIEAQGPEDRRYFKAFIADSLAGAWRPLPTDTTRQYASMDNVEQTEGIWTNGISHGELIRTGYDEKLEANIHAPFIYQGILHEVRDGLPYGKIPWDLGILEPVKMNEN
jgi:hypothetical protein